MAKGFTKKDRMEPIIVTPTITMGSIITLLIYLCAIISTATWLKITSIRHDAVLFYKNGETRLVSKDALEKGKDECAARRNLASDHIVTEIKRVDMWNSVQVQHLSIGIEKLSDKMDKMSTAITILSVGGKPNMEDN